MKSGDINPQRLFTIEDVTDRVEEIASGVEDRSEEMWEIIVSSTCPDIEIGPHGSNPYDCLVT